MICTDAADLGFFSGRRLVVAQPEPVAAGSLGREPAIAGSVDGTHGEAESSSRHAIVVPLALTPAGSEVLERLVAARREQLAELFAEWGPEKHERIVKMLNRLARELVPEARPGDSAKIGASSARERV